MNADKASELAARRVGAAHADAHQRIALAEGFYPPALRAYGRAEIAFLRWELARGVFDPETGSPWWRAINDRLLHDKLEAALLHHAGVRDGSTPGARLWLEFLTAPSPTAWYRAHNRSIVAGYLEHQELAEAELPAERLMINVTLMRVLFTHALVARPRLALGRFGRLGGWSADPRRSSVRLFLDLRNVFPEVYPLTNSSVNAVLALEGRVARTLDYGLIVPKLEHVYAFAAEHLDEPMIVELVDNGDPCYAGLRIQRGQLASDSLIRLLARATRPRLG
ncbi:hypothetical protein OG874_19045 [Nocardia sp. NBC_00565]|uniref:hypothetical protein n=1 Tax=Nocardia sp. NBC_00565 TaxID=2975993 RepID=UPI002E81131A|nr:hypothetical protein [Nocardia sp. NBC_00565]WUC07065.1 hypothetical protein OG874_19045 [Nocardia sp. NBC_00565]